jgi:hypothetical protein
MLGLSNHFEYNVTLANSFKDEFGGRNVLLLASNQGSERMKRHVTSSRFSGRFLFAEDIGFNALKNKLNDGWKIRVTEFGEEYSQEQWLSDNPEAVMLFSLRKNGDLKFNTIDEPLAAGADDKLFYLTAAKKDELAQDEEQVLSEQPA